MYIAFPVLLYAGERIFRAVRSGSYEVDILKVFDLINFQSTIHENNCFKFSVSLDNFLWYGPRSEKISNFFVILVKDNYYLALLFDNSMQVSLCPGKVLYLRMQKPEGFKYQSGMYIFLQCPQISSFEWYF